MRQHGRIPTLTAAMGMMVLLPVLLLSDQAEAFFPFPDWDSDKGGSDERAPAPEAGGGECTNAQVYCHGQGHCSTDGSGCVCDNGWTGPFCERPLEDLQVTAVGPGVQPASTMEGALVGGAYHCYTYTVDPDHNWNYFAIELNKTATAGDPDLYIKPGSYPTQTDFVARDYSSQKTSVVTLTKADLGDEDFFKKWYVCVYAFGNQKTQYSLRAAVSHCPVVFQASGPEQCNGHGQCNIFHARCNCNSAYNVLGFPDCSASILNLAPASAANLSGSTVLYENSTIEPAHWQFFQVKVDSSEIELTILMSRLSTVGDPDLYLRYGSPPTLQVYDKKDSTYDNDHEIRVSQAADGDLFQSGTWFVGVYGYGPKDSDYEVRVQVDKCPSGCSGHGTCNALTHECHCHGDNFLSDPPDCSAQLVQLTSTATVVVEPSEMQLLEVNVTDQQKQARAELKISATITSESNSDSLPFPFLFLGSEHPKMLVKFGSYPNDSSYDFVQPFLHHTAQVHIPTSMVVPGTWWVEIDNPTIERLEVRTDMSLEGICNEASCNGHGTCNPSTGLCTCDPGYVGERECVAESPLPSCIDGSTKIVQSTTVPQRKDFYNCSGGHFLKLPSGHFCQEGYTLHGLECQAVADSGCSKGSMLKTGSVAHGQCMSACTCTNGVCKYATTSHCVVHCDAGYFATEEKGALFGMACQSATAAQPSDDTQDRTHTKEAGIGSGMATLLAFSMLAVGAALCYGTLWYVRRRGIVCGGSSSSTATGRNGDYLLHDLALRHNNEI